MNRTKPKTLTPKRRFHEFRDAPGWDAVELRGLSEVINDRAGTKKCVPMSITTGVGLVSQQEKFGRTIHGDSYKNYYRLQADDFAYNKSATKDFPQGYIAKYAGKGPGAVPNSIFTCFRPDQDKVVPEYLDYLFASNLHGKWLHKFITVGARAHGALAVTDDDLMAMPIPLPPSDTDLAEQQKIADCLGSLDDWLAAAGRKLAALRDHKRGLMQQLFPQPGQSQPQQRFPEFRKAGKWSEKTIGELGKVITGSTPSTKDRSFYDGPHMFVSPADISELRFVNTTNTTLSDDGFAETRKVEAMSILFVCIGSTIGKVAQNIEECATNQQINAIVPNNECFGDFLYYLLTLYSETIAALAGNHAVPIINKSLFSSVSVLMPQLPEQQKIAACLTTLDTQITAQAQQIDALKQHKRGLMQQLFPSPEGPAS